MKAFGLVQGLSLQLERGHHRYFLGLQVPGEIVLFLNLRSAPAPRPVELDDHGLVALHWLVQLDAVDPIFVRAQGQQAPIAVDAYSVKRIEHPCWIQSGKRKR